LGKDERKPGEREGMLTMHRERYGEIRERERETEKRMEERNREIL